MNQLVSEILDGNQPEKKSIMRSLFGIFRKDKDKQNTKHDKHQSYITSITIRDEIGMSEVERPMPMIEQSLIDQSEI
jgi:hypothetical protein